MFLIVIQNPSEQCDRVTVSQLPSRLVWNPQEFKIRIVELFFFVNLQAATAALQWSLSLSLSDAHVKQSSFVSLFMYMPKAISGACISKF